MNNSGIEQSGRLDVGFQRLQSHADNQQRLLYTIGTFENRNKNVNNERNY